MHHFSELADGPRWTARSGRLCALGSAVVAIMGGVLAGLSQPGANATEPANAAVAPVGLRHADLTRRITALATKHPRRIKTATIGKSFRGRDITVIEIRSDAPRDDASRGALLVVAGLSATRVAATDVAMALAERWADPTPTSMPTTAATTSRPASQPAHILDVCDVYILPRLNVDGAERFLSQPREANDRSDEPVDDDRDRAADDNGPSDLNSDGFITQMRVRDPEATHMIDDKDARLMRPADRAVAERPVYKMYTESLDLDGDGEYAEDGPGGVDLDRNFPHAYQPHVSGTGRYALSAPETRALAEYVIAHPEILGVVVLDRGDNLAAGGGGETVPEDEAMWKRVAERYKEIVAVTDAPRGITEGSFAAWAYRQRGLPTVVTALWQLPKDEPASQPTSGPASQPAATQPDGAAESTAPPESPPAAPPREEARPGPRGRPDGAGGGRGGGGRMGRGGGRRGGGGGGPPGVGRPTGESGGGAGAASTGDKGDIEKDRRWLQYADKHRDMKAHVDWTPFQHPTLGDVEIGGFIPGFRENAPSEAIPDIVDRQIRFISEFAAMLPRPRVAGVKVIEKATDVFEIELSLINDTYLPTALAMTRTANRDMPFVLRPDVPPESILGGRPVEKIAFLDGSGGTNKVRWLIRAPRGEKLTIRVFNKQFKMSDVTVDLVPTPTTTQVSP